MGKINVNSSKAVQNKPSNYLYATKNSSLASVNDIGNSQENGVPSYVFQFKKDIPYKLPTEEIFHKTVDNKFLLNEAFLKKLQGAKHNPCEIKKEKESELSSIQKEKRFNLLQLAENQRQFAEMGRQKRELELEKAKIEEERAKILYEREAETLKIGTLENVVKAIKNTLCLK